MKCTDDRRKLKRRRTRETAQYSFRPENNNLQVSAESSYKREKQVSREKTSSGDDSRGHSLTCDRFHAASVLKIGGNHA